MKLVATESEKKLKEIQQNLGLPVKLSDVEKEKFTGTFSSLKTWLDDALEVVLKMNRDPAYRYIKLLIDGLVKVDVDFVAGVDTRPPEPGVEPVLSLENIEQPVEPAEPIIPAVRPTKEQVDGWLSELDPSVRVKAEELVDCIKQYVDPDGAGIDVICNHCSREEMEQCIRNADPSFQDSGSIFMKHQLEG